MHGVKLFKTELGEKIRLRNSIALFSPSSVCIWAVLCALRFLFPSKSGWSGLSSEMRKTEAAIYAMVWQIRVLLKSSEMLSLVGSSHMHALEAAVVRRCSLLDSRFHPCRS